MVKVGEHEAEKKLGEGVWGFSTSPAFGSNGSSERFHVLLALLCLHTIGIVAPCKFHRFPPQMLFPQSRPLCLVC